MKVNWLNGEENQLEDDLVDWGAATSDALKKTQVAAEKKRKFRNQCKNGFEYFALTSRRTTVEIWNSEECVVPLSG